MGAVDPDGRWFRACGWALTSFLSIVLSPLATILALAWPKVSGRPGEVALPFSISVISSVQWAQSDLPHNWMLDLGAVFFFPSFYLFCLSLSVSVSLSYLSCIYFLLSLSSI